MILLLSTKYKVKFNILQVFFIFVFIISFLFIFRINVFADDDFNKIDDTDNSTTYGQNHIQYTLARYKCEISDKKYNGCVKDNDGNYIGIKGQDYMVSDKNIKYFPLVIATGVPAFADKTNDFKEGEPRYITEGADVKQNYISNNKKNSPTVNNPEYPSVILYLHRITPKTDTI